MECLLIFPVIYTGLCYKLFRKADKGNNLALEAKLGDYLVFVLFMILMALKALTTRNFDIYDLIVFSYLPGFLFFQAYTDKKMKKIYFALDIIAIAIGGLLSVYWLFHCEDIYLVKIKLVQTFTLTALLLLAKKFKVYGDGDGEVIFAISLLILPTTHILSIAGLFLGLALGMGYLLITQLIKRIKGNREKTFAMVPGITFGVSVAMLIG